MCKSDQELLSDYAQRRDAEAFAELVARYQTLVFATSVRQLGNRADAEEVAQEVFLALATHARTITAAKLGGWLYRSAVNATYSRLRTDRARKDRERARAMPDRQVDKAAEWHQIEEVLDVCLAELSDDDRELIVERFFLGRQQREMARDWSVDQSTISRRLSGAVDQLRRHMARRGLTVTAAALAAGLAEYASAATLPPGLAASLNKIGVAGVGGKSAASVSVLGIAPVWWIVAAAVLTLSMIVAIGVRAGGQSGPTSTVVVPTRRAAVTTLYELTRLDYTRRVGSGALAINAQGMVVSYVDRPEGLVGLYVVDGGRFRRLRRFPTHTRRSMAIGPGTLVAFSHDRHIDLVSGDNLRSLTGTAAIDVPTSINGRRCVAFVESEPTSRIRVADENSIRTVHEAGDAFDHFDEVCINDDGDLAFRAMTAGGVEGIYLSRQGEVAAVAEVGDTYQQFQPRLDFNDRGRVAFVARRVDGTDVICLGDDEDLEEVVRCGDFFAQIHQVSLNDRGPIAFTARRPDEPVDPPVHGLYLWDGGRVVQLMAQGQEIGDAVLQGTMLWRDCLNDAGQIVTMLDFGRGHLAAAVRLDTAAVTQGD